MLRPALKGVRLSAGSLPVVNDKAIPSSAPTLAGIGVVGGALSGLLGVGGGIFIVPMLALLAHLTQHSAHATSLAAVIPIALAGSLAFGSQHNVDIEIALLLAAGSLVGAPLGARIMAGLKEATLKSVFGVLLIVVGALLALR